MRSIDYWLNILINVEPKNRTFHCSMAVLRSIIKIELWRWKLGVVVALWFEHWQLKLEVLGLLPSNFFFSIYFILFFTHFHLSQVFFYSFSFVTKVCCEKFFTSLNLHFRTSIFWSDSWLSSCNSGWGPFK